MSTKRRLSKPINDDRAAFPRARGLDYPSAGDGVVPRNDFERVVAQIFSEVLETTVTARDSHFFQLGGDSLLAIRVVIRCQERLKINLPTTAVFDCPTVAQLADRLRHEKNLRPVAERAAHVPRGRATPLSPQQFALWLDLKIRPDADAYNEIFAFRIGRRLEPARLIQALAKLADAHEVLRARLVELDGRPQLVFDREATAVEFEFLDSGGSDKLTEATQRPFKLHDGPLWRAILCNEPGGSVLALVIHHIILDHASADTLLGELIAHYSGSGTPRAPGAYDFADLAATEHHRLASEAETLERFWTKNLASAKLTLDLPPGCRPCSPEAEDRACISRREIEPALARRIRDLAAGWGSTPFHLYLTAYLALLRKYAASDDLVIGSPLSLRDTPMADGVVGYLLSPALLRVQLTGERSFRQTVEDVAHRWREVCAHARLPMHSVLKSALEGQRTGIRPPVQTYFSLARDLTDSVLIDGCALEQIHLPPAHAKFNSFLLVMERQKDASLVLEYRRGIFDPDMADRFLRHLEVLLLAATENPNLPLAKLPLADQSELAQLREWASHPRSYPRDRTVTEIFEEVAREFPGKTAVVAGGDRISYGALDSRANAVATALRSAGVSEGDRVPLLLPRGVQFIACALGVMKCGAVYVPLDPSYPAEQLRRRLEGLQARIGLGKRGPSIGNGTINWLDVDMVEESSTVSAPPPPVQAANPAYVMFTSGSTGRPKAVEVPHRAIVRLVFGQDFARMGPAETWLHMAPTSFDASTLEIWAPLLHGGCCVIAEETVPDPRVLAELIRKESVTSAWITSSLFNLIVDEAPACLSGLTQILIGGEALSPTHVRRAFDHLPGVRFVNGYGPTENTTFTCCHVIRREDIEPGRSIPIGRPIANTTVRVVDSDGRLAPIGVPGELLAGGDGVALGYIGQPQLTQQSFLTDTFSDEPGARLYRSGDRVRWRPDGALEFLGRFDNQVKIRGYRVEPDEVAVCISEHERVRQAVVVPHRAPSGATQLLACVVPNSEDYSVAELRKLLARHAAERLPAHMVPAKFLFFRDLPLKPNGKLDFAALEDLKDVSAPVRADVPLSSTEARILKTMRGVLRRQNLGPDADFFENGGDSLLAVDLMLRLQNEIGKELPARVLDGAFTARRIAGFLESPSHTYPAGVVEIKEGTNGRPLFCLLGAGATVLEFRSLAAKLRTRRPMLAFELHNLLIDPSVFDSIENTAAAIVERMREIQPIGPYAIVGYSYGGNLAVEVSRQLIANGRSVEVAVVLDAYAPGALSITAPPRATETQTERIKRHFGILIRSNLRQAWAYISLRRRISKTCKRCMSAIADYRAAAFPGRIVLVRADNRDDWIEVVDSSGTSGWSSICEGGVDVVPIACHHLDLLKEPHVMDVAQYIDRMLIAIDRS